MFSNIFAAPCTIKLNLLQNVIFLSPPDPSVAAVAAAEGLPPTSYDQLVRGIVEVTCPSPRKITSIRVTLRVIQSVALLLDSNNDASGVEESVILEKVIEIRKLPTESDLQLTGSHNSSESSSTTASDHQVSRPRSTSPRFGKSADSDEGLELSCGVHAFEFGFIMPSDTAPYDRSTYGRVKHIVTAVGVGAGRAKTNIESSRELWPVGGYRIRLQTVSSEGPDSHRIRTSSANPNPDGGPLPLSVVYNDIHESLGLFGASFTSSNISVGAVFSFDMRALEVPADTTVHLVRISLETDIELRTKKLGVQRVPKRKIKLFEQGYIPPSRENLADRGAGSKENGYIRDCQGPSEWNVTGMARMPDDNVIRPTTLPGSRAAIRHSHSLLLEVIHSSGKSELDQRPTALKVFTMRQAITVPSCCASYDSIVLPKYSRRSIGGSPTRRSNLPSDIRIFDDASNDPSSPLHHSTRAAAQCNCTCGQSFADLSARELRLFPPQPSATNDQISCLGKIADYQPASSLGDTTPPSPSLSPRASPSQDAEVERGPTSDQQLALRALRPIATYQPSEPPPSYACALEDDLNVGSASTQGSQ